MAQLFSNNATTTLAADLTAAATSLSVAAGDGAKFPVPANGDYFLATLYTTDASGNVTADEIVKVTANAADTWTIVRAQEGTAAQAWSASTAKLFLGLTAAPVSSLVRSTAGMQLAGRWSTAVCSTSDFGGFSSGSLLLASYIVPVGGERFDRMAIMSNSGTAGSSYRLGIYDSDGAGLPAALLLDAGSLDTSSPGVVTGILTIDVTIKGGRIWLAALPLGAGTCQVRRNITAPPIQISCANDSEVLSSTQPIGYVLTGQAGLPASLAGAAFAATNQVVRIALRGA